MRFIDLHPFSLIVFFTSVTVFTMITMNPIMLILSFFGAILSVAKNKTKLNLLMYLPFFVLISLTNPIFSHNGKTVLFFMFEQRITLEAIIYGIFSAVLILAVVFWFRLFSTVFTQDKLSWLVGKISPKLSVIFCLTVRFIPLLKENAKSIYQSQLSLGIFDTKKLSGKLRLLTNVFSSLVSMSIENGIDTADTMRSRGFGKSKRSMFSLFNVSKRDVQISLVILCLDILISWFLFIGEGSFYYYPEIKFSYTIYITPVFYAIYALLCFVPIINDIMEDIKWKYLISKI